MQLIGTICNAGCAQSAPSLSPPNSDLGAAQSNLTCGVYEGNINAVGDGGLQPNSVVWIAPGKAYATKYGILITLTAAPGCILQYVYPYGAHTETEVPMYRIYANGTWEDFKAM